MRTGKESRWQNELSLTPQIKSDTAPVVESSRLVALLLRKIADFHTLAFLHKVRVPFSHAFILSETKRAPQLTITTPGVISCACSGPRSPLRNGLADAVVPTG